MLVDNVHRLYTAIYGHINQCIHVHVHDDDMMYMPYKIPVVLEGEFVKLKCVRQRMSSASAPLHCAQ